jgi:hypothetical protein
MGQRDFLWVMKFAAGNFQALAVKLRLETYFLPIVRAFSFRK